MIQKIIYVLSLLFLSIGGELTCEYASLISFCENVDDSFISISKLSFTFIDQSYTSSKSLSINRCKIVSVHPDTFDPFSGIITLNLSGNYLKEITNENFRNVPGLQVIDLSCNAISSIHPDTFINHLNMTNLNLTDNLLFMHTFKQPVIPKLNGIFTLEIENNNPDFESFRVISQDGYMNGTNTLIHRAILSNFYSSFDDSMDINTKISFIISESTSKLLLSYNNLNSLSKDVFLRCRKLYFLKLSYNRLESLHGDVFSRLIILRTLHLHNNDLVNLPENLFRNNRRIQLINISNNRIRNLPAGIFRNSVELVGLRLSNNFLTSLSANIFNTNTKLSTLDLSGNNLKILETSIFEKNLAIQGLDLSRNELEHFPYESISNMENIIQLRLDNNRLLKLDIRFFNGLKKLNELSIYCNNLTHILTPEIRVKTLYLHGNPWKCSCLNKILSMKFNFKINGVSNNIPFVCISKSLFCDESPISGTLFLEWYKATKYYSDSCNIQLEPILII